MYLRFRAIPEIIMGTLIRLIRFKVYSFFVRVPSTWRPGGLSKWVI